MQISRLFAIILMLILWQFSVRALPVSITTQAGSNQFPLVAASQSATIVWSSNDAEVVGVAAEALSSDISLLTGLTPAIKTDVTGVVNPVLVGTIGRSMVIDDLISKGKISTAQVVGKWETFMITLVDNPYEGVSKALVICGSDPRGTAFGVFELSRMMGVSPFVWWADVTPEHKENIFINSGETVVGPPAVKYRGIFLNDEDWGLKPWAAKMNDTDVKDIGPKTYAKIFELLLRLKANYIWPAMHDCTKAFWYYAQNPIVARKYQIVLGSSHCEPMLRDNVWEWTSNFSNEYGITPGEFNWATNKDQVVTYWKDRVIGSVNNDATYTLGIRGVHDGQMLGYSTDAQRVVAVKDVIATQRSLLQNNLGKEVSTVPQIYCPYKEVLTLYRMGLDLPEDVTIVWADDNHGYMRQLSSPTEQARSGGGGVYYHLSYWGVPMDYLWLTSTSPSLISFEMSKAYSMNTKKLWVFNVGDIKPAECELQFSMDMAWNPQAWTPLNASTYTLQWAKEIFGEALAPTVAEIKNEYYRLAAAGKPEHIHKVAFTQAEMEQRLTDYANLLSATQALDLQIPTRLKDAYFQLIAYPVEGAAQMNEKIFCAQMSNNLAVLGNPDALNYASRATAAHQRIQLITSKYNTQIAGGKWNGIMSAAPRGLSQFSVPTVATSQTVSSVQIPAPAADVVTNISATSFTSKNDAGYTIATLKGLGISGDALSVWPLNMTTYTIDNISTAPYVEYEVPVQKGTNTISVKCLPTMPIYDGMSLRYGISIDGAAAQLVTVGTNTEAPDWPTNVLRGHTKSTYTYTSALAKTILVRIYFADPGVALSALSSSAPYTSPYTQKIINPSFENIDAFTVNNGTTYKGKPYAWNQIGTVAGNSFGINNDAANFDASNVCWYNVNAAPYAMPADFQLYQTVKNMPSGKYVVRCLMSTLSGYTTNERMFANKNTQYFGVPSLYANNQVSGEKKTFASYIPVSSMTKCVMSEMAVRVILDEGDSLRIGIKSSNVKGDGTIATGASATTAFGSFKVDNFRLERVGDVPTRNEAILNLTTLIHAASESVNSATHTNPTTTIVAAATILQTQITASEVILNTSISSLEDLLDTSDQLSKAYEVFKKSAADYTAKIINPSFEYKANGVLQTEDVLRVTPYGWSQMGTILGTSFGTNKDMTNLDGTYGCWYLSSPMPPNFMLYQDITGLDAGEYTVKCRMAAFEGLITTQRLFANNNVQYYGNQSNYTLNKVSGEDATYAGLSPLASSGGATLSEMEVKVQLAAGEVLRIGVKTNNTLPTGVAATNNSGWFKVDNFTLTRNMDYVVTDAHLSDPVSNLFSVVVNGKNIALTALDPKDKYSKLLLLNSCGVELKSITLNTNTVNMKVPVSGVYLLLFFRGDKTCCRKVFVP